MSKVLSFVAGITCLSFFKKLFVKCYSKEDVDAMAKKYEDYQTKSFTELEDKLSKSKYEASVLLKEKDQEISIIKDKLKECTETAGRIASERERTIVKLNDEIKNLKSQIANDNKAHNEALNNVRTECENKVKKIQKECADSLLKADKKATKEKEKKDALPKTPRNPNNTGKPELTCDQVIEIRNIASQPSKPTNKELAETYGVGASTISRIISGKSYKQCLLPETEKKTK